LFEGYLDDDETTNRAFERRDGFDWFKTGDMVSADETGALRFVGRADDVIKVAGENVSLSEVEAVVAQAPGIFEACVVAKPDPIRDVVPVAYLVASDPQNPPDEAALEEYAAAHLAPQSRPRAWHFVDSLPRTSVGKIRRFVLAGDSAEEETT
jgi:crotonobetaine/carnitine-CoA ligase